MDFLKWNKLPSTQYDNGEYWHARGTDGRRYTVTSEEDVVSIHEHVGLGDTHRMHLISEFRFTSFGSIREAFDRAERWDAEQKGDK